MLKIGPSGSIALTHGDSARLNVNISYQDSDKSYQLTSDDTLWFSVKKRLLDADVVLQKEIKGTSTFMLVPDDTKNLSPGAYVYDVQLKTASGDVYTLVPPSVFDVLPEVCCL